MPCDGHLLSPVCVPSTSGLDVLTATKRIFAVLDPSDTYWSDVLTLFGLAICWKIIGISTICYKAQKQVGIGDPRNVPTDGLTAARIATIDGSTTKRGIPSHVRSKGVDNSLSSDDDASEVDV